MTGGGFGGSTVTLIAANRADAIRERLESEYRQKTDIEPTLFTTRPAAGSFLARGGAEGNKSET
jgi:galactokinase